MSDQSPAGIGDNSSRALLDTYREQNASLPAFLATEHGPLIQMLDDLRAECESAPALVDSDDLEKSATDLGGKLAKARKQIRDSRKTVKDAISPGVKIADDFFSKLEDPVDLALRSVERRVNAWKDTKKLAADAARREEERKAAEAKRLADEAAQRARQAEEEARRLHEDASATAEQKSAAWYAAQDASKEVIQTHVAAKTAAAELSTPVGKVTTVAVGESGAKSVQRANWTGDIVDLVELDVVTLLPYITRAALDSAVRAFAIDTKGTKPLAGARIYERTATSFR